MAKKEEVKVDLVAQAMAKLDKDFGKGTIMGARDKHQVIDYVSTGSIGLDKALGIGGVPRGRHIEIYGPESSGKTTLAAHIIAEAMLKSNKRCAFVDMEHALDLAYIESLGVNLDRLLISQPDYGEQALEVVDALVNTGEIDVIVVDSISSLVPKAEIDRDMGESSMGKQAALMSQALRKLTPSVEKTGTIIIWINQLREKIGVMFGNPETTTGGNAMKFYASVRLDIRRKVINKEDEEAVSNTVEVKVVKNKVAPPFKSAKFDIVYGEGINKFKEVLEKAVDLNIIEKSGSWYAYEGNKLGQGFDNVKDLFIDNNELFEEVKKKVLDNYSFAEIIKEPEVEEVVDVLESLPLASEIKEDGI